MLAIFSPPLALSLVISSIYAALFHLWQGQRAAELLHYLLASWLGFGLGELAGDFLDLDILIIGQVHALEGSIASWLLLLVVKWRKM
ncbi:MAG: hypothetical protein U9R11_04125 [Chloroflexota bacterium]|nr:hypothetical protein [Chloroflexota bacterium]